MHTRDRRAERPHTGRRAEDLAVAALQAGGLHIVARNWRRPEGEIDVVADDRGACVFVEVRSRTGTAHGHALETIDARKRGRVIRAARLYLAEEQPAATSYRFDVVAVTFPDDGGAPALEWLPDAFETT